MKPPPQEEMYGSKDTDDLIDSVNNLESEGVSRDGGTGLPLLEAKGRMESSDIETHNGYGLIFKTVLNERSSE